MCDSLNYVLLNETFSRTALEKLLGRPASWFHDQGQDLDRAIIPDGLYKCSHKDAGTGKCPASYYYNKDPVVYPMFGSDFREAFVATWKAKIKSITTSNLKAKQDPFKLEITDDFVGEMEDALKKANDSLLNEFKREETRLKRKWKSKIEKVNGGMSRHLPPLIKTTLASIEPLKYELYKTRYENLAEKADTILHGAILSGSRFQPQPQPQPEQARLGLPELSPQAKEQQKDWLLKQQYMAEMEDATRKGSLVERLTAATKSQLVTEKPKKHSRR